MLIAIATVTRRWWSRGKNKEETNKEDIGVERTEKHKNEERMGSRKDVLRGAVISSVGKKALSGKMVIHNRKRMQTVE